MPILVLVWVTHACQTAINGRQMSGFLIGFWGIVKTGFLLADVDIM